MVTINGESIRIKRENEKDLVEATNNKNYKYKLSKEDMQNIICYVYNSFNDPCVNDLCVNDLKYSSFIVIDSPNELLQRMELFINRIPKDNAEVQGKLVCMIDLGDRNWASLILVHLVGFLTSHYAQPHRLGLPDVYKNFLEKKKYL